MAVLKIMILSSTQNADDASDRAHDGRHRQRVTQITKPTKSFGMF